MEKTVTEDSTAPHMSCTNVERQKNTSSSKCKICEAPAQYSYYGAIAILKCHFDNDCDININNRHTCASCRLAKCFISGMSIEMIRSHR
ncbi:unnamed protein product, partial [Rotaria sp. Silwood1]